MHNIMMKCSLTLLISLRNVSLLWRSLGTCTFISCRARKELFQMACLCSVISLAAGRAHGILLSPYTTDTRVHLLWVILLKLSPWKPHLKFILIRCYLYTKERGWLCFRHSLICYACVLSQPFTPTLTALYLWMNVLAWVGGIRIYLREFVKKKSNMFQVFLAI